MTFSSDEELRLRISEHQAKAGRQGGLSRSPEKQRAVAENLKKARAKRWPGRVGTLEVGNNGNAQEAPPQSPILGGEGVTRGEREAISLPEGTSGDERT